MYMFPIDSDIYAAMPWRRWWAPWCWALDVYRWGPAFAILEAQTIATNISRAEVIGLMKLLGYEQEIKC
jgi:hypothetical protein